MGNMILFRLLDERLKAVATARDRKYRVRNVYGGTPFDKARVHFNKIYGSDITHARGMWIRLFDNGIRKGAGVGNDLDAFGARFECRLKDRQGEGAICGRDQPIGKI